MRLHPKVPLVALLALVHLRVTLTRAVLGGTGRSNQGGIDYGACFKHQTLASQGGVDGGQQQGTEFVVLEQMTEPQDGALIGHASHAGVQAGILAVQRDAVKSFFHGRVRHAKPLLHEVNTQYGGHCKGWATRLARWGVRLHQRHQLRPRNNRFISSRNSRLRVLLVTNSKPVVAELFCFVGIYRLCRSEG
jgi:hypothetical protein